MPNSAMKSTPAEMLNGIPRRKPEEQSEHASRCRQPAF